MSMLDSFFKQGFKASKCKTLLKLTIPRIKLLRNRRDIHLKQMRREIAKLLETGQEATARIRVEHIIREENMMAAQEILELFCELISVRLPIIESQRECPLDLKEAISSVCFAAPRCADLPELLQVQLLFASKYGKEFVSAATELMPSCGVNRQLIELLSVRAPSPEKKLKLLKEIAEEHGIEWDPAASETEFFKPHEDLLNGPTKFVGESELSLPNEKHDEAQNSAPEQPDKEQAGFDSDSDLDDLLLPEVPKVSVRATANVTSEMPEAVPHPEIDDKSSVHSGVAAELKQQPYGVDEEVTRRISADDKGEPYSSPCAVENKQFLPFLSPPSVSTAPLSSMQTLAGAYSSSPSTSFSAESDNSPHTLTRNKSEAHVDLQDSSSLLNTSFPAGSDNCHTLPRKKSEANVDLQDSSSPSNTSFPAGSDNSPHTLPTKKSEANVDLQDVIAAAHAAAETAERAAAAARSAATLAQARIGELTKKNSANILESSYENPFHVSTSDEADAAEPKHFSDQPTSNNSDGVSGGYSATHWDYGSTGGFEHSMASFDKFKADFDSSLPYHHLAGEASASHRPHRLPSMEDETYLSFPNLFTSQNSINGSHSPRNVR